MRISDWSSDVCSSDKLFKGVTVVDGSGAAAFAGDVAVTEGRIAAAAPTLDGEADEAIEGRGRVLAPGFIDVHTPDDRAVLNAAAMLPQRWGNGRGGKGGGRTGRFRWGAYH